MSQPLVLSTDSPTSGQSRLPLASAYAIEALTSISVNFLMNGIAFYTTQRFGWSAMQNLLLMMAQGVVYAAGALSAGPLAGRFSKRILLAVVSASLLFMSAALWAMSSPSAIVGMLLVYTFTSTLTWPLVESFVTEGCGAKRMNRRITIYNMCWSSVSVLVIAVYGAILTYWPDGPMIIPVACHALGLAAAIVLLLKGKASGSAVVPAEIHGGDPEVAGKLASSRVLALWLARISLPASFVVANSLMGIFPRLNVSAEIGVVWTSVLASLWLASRFCTFIVLGASNWWHTRPRLLLLAALLVLVSFLLIGLPGERIGPFASTSLAMTITLVAGAELLLGVMMGYIFSASLYFGMVLSDGSTEHGGYHEALIGAGMVMGPGLAAGAQYLGPTGERWPAIAAVTTLMVLTISVASGVTLRFRQKAMRAKHA